MQPSAQEVQEILGIFRDSSLRRLHLEVGGIKLALNKDDGPGAMDAAVAAAAAGSQPVAVTSPAVGWFRRRPAASQAMLVEVGSQVAATDPIGLVEIVSGSGPVFAGRRGRVVEILVEDGAVVEYGQRLMLIEPA